MSVSVNFDGFDYVIIAIYFGLVFFIGWWARKHEGLEGFLLGGRQLTLPLFVASLTSSWYGGILGIGEFTFLYGISNWVTQALPYYIFALIFAVFLAKKIRQSEFLTVPQRMAYFYGEKTGKLAAVLICLLSSPAPYLLSLGIFIQLIFGTSLVWSMLLGGVLSTSFLWRSGFASDVMTDLVEFLFMFAGFAILAISCLKLWGFPGLLNELPANHTSFTGGNSVQFIVVWFFIALWTLVDPSFHQRCAAAKNVTIARYGIILSVLGWAVFDGLTLLCGLYAKAYFVQLDNTLWAFPLLAEELLGSGFKGLFWVGMMATVMSTLNTTLFISGITVGHDLIKKPETGTDDTASHLVRWGLFISAALAFAMAYLMQSIIQLWYSLASLAVPGLLIPLVWSFFGRQESYPSKFWSFMTMLAGSTTAAVWLSMGWMKAWGSYDHYPLGLQPLFPGLLVSLMLWCIGLGIKRLNATKLVRT